MNLMEDITEHSMQAPRYHLKIVYRQLVYGQIIFSQLVYRQLIYSQSNSPIVNE